jgi:hypothetical protein
VHPHELRGSEQQPEHSEDNGIPTDTPGGSVAADNLLRSGTVRFRRLLVGCQPVWGHEANMSLGEPCFIPPSIRAEHLNSDAVIANDRHRGSRTFPQWGAAARAPQLAPIRSGIEKRLVWPGLVFLRKVGITPSR